MGAELPKCRAVGEADLVARQGRVCKPDPAQRSHLETMSISRNNAL